MKLRVALAALSLAVVGCSDDATDTTDARVIDAAVDAPIDAPDGACGADYQMTGEYIDWDATNTLFDGVEEAVWTVAGDTARTAMTAPNGRIILCLARDATVNIDVVQTLAAPDGPYVDALFVADPAVLSPAGGIFSARGLQIADRDARYQEIAASGFDTAAGHVLVVKRGTPGPLTLGAAASFVSDGVDDTSWTAGGTGTFTLFPNVPVGNGTATLGGTFTGPTSIPLAAGKLTIVPISD